MDRGRTVLLALLIAAFVALYAGVLYDLVLVWWASDVYQHGFLVLPIALYLVWLRRERLWALPVQPGYAPGVAVILVATAGLFVGKAGGIAMAGEMSMLVMIAGVVLLVLGPAHLGALAMPILYLTFMVPIFNEGTDWVHWPFQLLAANIGVAILHLLGFAAYQQAEMIELPNVTLEVAEACSGIRYMLSVVAIGLPLAYATQATTRRRTVLVLFALGIGIIANGVRVALIGVLAYFGAEVIKGPFHVLQALFVAWVGYAALIAGAWYLRRLPVPVATRSVEEPS